MRCVLDHFVGLYFFFAYLLFVVTRWQSANAPRTASVHVECTCMARMLLQAYRALAKEWHPDKNDSEEAGQLFYKIVEAYEVLAHAESRRWYDLAGGDERCGQPACQGKYSRRHVHTITCMADACACCMPWSATRTCASAALDRTVGGAPPDSGSTTLPSHIHCPPHTCAQVVQAVCMQG